MRLKNIRLTHANKLILCGISAFLFSSVSLRSYSQNNLVINEFMSSNKSFLYDEDGDDPDWIELYNSGSEPVQLSEYYLSDKKNKLKRWQLPDTVLAPDSFLLIFASGKNRGIPGKELHTNFSIKKKGENLFMSKLGEEVQSIPSVKLKSNTSYGFIRDGGGALEVFRTPTPGASNKNSEKAHQLIFNKKGGFYKSTFQLKIATNAEGATVRYTADGTKPSPNSKIYKKPFLLSDHHQSQADIYKKQVTIDSLHFVPEDEHVLKSIVIRAAAFDDEGNQLTDVVTNSYFIKELGIDHNLPVVSVSVDTASLFDHQTGIYTRGVHFDENNPDWTGNFYMHGREWEREVNIEFYEAGTSIGFNQITGMRIHGGNSRRTAQKGLRFYARSEYGNPQFNYKLFPDREMTSYKRFVLKPFYTPWSKSGTEDYICNKTARKLNVDHIATRPAVLYLNGEYRGIYYIQERIDKRLFENRLGIKSDEISIVEGPHSKIKTGDNKDFIELLEFAENSDLSLPSNYRYIKQKIDLDNFIDYHIFQIFIANNDWPDNNNRKRKEHSDTAKWRWIFFDGDVALGWNKFYDGFSNALYTVDYSSNGNNMTLILRKLMDHPDFKNRFISRFQELMNTSLHPNHTLEIHHTVRETLEREIQNQINHFIFPKSYEDWEGRTENTFRFLRDRNCIVKAQIKTRFNEDVEFDENIGFDEDVELDNIDCREYLTDKRLYIQTVQDDTIRFRFSTYTADTAEITLYHLQKGFQKSIKLKPKYSLNPYQIGVSDLPKGLYLFTINQLHYRENRRIHIGSVN